MFNLSTQWLVVALDVSLKAVLLAGAAAFVLRLPRLRDSNLRHRAWTGVLIGMLLLPALSRTVPALQLPIVVPDAWQIATWDESPPETYSTPKAEPPAQPITADDPQTTLLNGVAGDPFTNPHRGGELWNDVDSLASPEWEFGAAPAPPAPVSDAALSPSSEPGAGRDEEPDAARAVPAVLAPNQLMSRWPVALVGIWVLGTCLMALRLLVGLLYSLRLVWCATAITKTELIELGVDPRLWAGTRRPVPIGECPLIRVPLALGVIRPRILLPSDWPTWPADKLHAVIAHERTHIQRADGAVIFLAELNRCLYWFHPLAWWLRTHLGKLAETACDDAAIDSTGDRATYARHLLEVAAAVSGQRSRLISAGISMARPSHVETRINAILDFTRPLSKRLTWTTTLLLLAALIPLIALAAAVRPSSGPATQQSVEVGSVAPHESEFVTKEAAVNSEDATASADEQQEEPIDSDDALAETTDSPAGASAVQTVDDNPAFTFVGTVVDERGQPVGDAAIALDYVKKDPTAARSTDVTHSNEQGRFQFTRRVSDFGDAYSPDYALLGTLVVAKKQGYGFALKIVPYFETSGSLAKRLDDERRLDSIRVRQWKEKNDGSPMSTLTLVPDDVPIRGRILNTEGRPISGALVQAIEIWESVDGSLDDFERRAELPGIEDSAVTNRLRSLLGGVPQVGPRARYVNSVTTDAEGRFTLKGLGRERVASLLITGDGIESTILQVRSRSGETIELSPDSATYRRDMSIYPADFTCIAGPSVPVVGRVLDSKTGAPLAHMSVEADRLNPSEGKTVFLMMHRIRDTTNEEGEYRLAGLPLGNSEILVQAPSGVPYVPGQVDVKTFAGSDAVTCDIEVARGVIARGLISDQRTSQPLSGQLTYFALSRNPHLQQADTFRESHARHWVDETGRYEIPILPGEGILAFMASNAHEFARGTGAESIDAPHQGNGNRSLFYTQPYFCSPANFNYLATLHVDADDNSITVDMALTSGLRIHGRVVTAEGESLSDYFVYGSQDPEYWIWVSGENVEISGYFPDKPRRLLFYHPGTNLVGDHVLRGPPPERFDVSLRQGATIKGRVVDVDGLPIPDLEIVGSHLVGSSRNELTFDEERQRGHIVLQSQESGARTDAEGRFEFHGIVPFLNYSAGVSRKNRYLGSIFHDVTAQPGETKDLGDVCLKPREDDTASAPTEPNQTTASHAASSVTKPETEVAHLSYTGRVATPEGEPIAGAKIWLAVASQRYTLEANRDNREGLLRELGTTDEQGRFEVVLDAVTTQEIRKRFNYYQTQLVATAEGRGLDWMPLDVFEDNPAPSANRDTLQVRIDQSLGDGSFASRTIKLRPESRPVRGRLVDLEGHPLPNVTVSVESLKQPDIPRLLKAFEMSWKREVNEALSATMVGVGGGLARSELQKLIPPVTTDENGEFELRGIGDDQLVTLVFDADRVEARPLHVLGRKMETVSLPYNPRYPGGSKDVFVGRDFTYAVGPSVPVEGGVTDYDTGEPVAGVLVYVERLFKEGSVRQEQLRLDTHHMRAVTDGQGRFRITGMPPGEGHVLEVIPPKSEPYLMISQDVSLSLEDGDAKRIEFQVKRGIWIEGRVIDRQSGEPLFATVDYFALKKNPHALDKLGLNRAWNDYQQRYVTDSDGHYRTLGLPGPGVLLVKTQVPGYPLAAGAETIDGYDASGGVIHTTPYPLRVKDWHLLKQIDPAAAAISSNCDLVLDAGLSIPGRVVGPDGKPISDLHVLGQTKRFEYWRPRHDDTVRMTDRFTVNGYDGIGPRQLFFKNQDETLVGQYRLEGDAPEEIVVTLQPSVRVTGRVIANDTDLPAARYFLNCERCSLNNPKYPPVNFMIHWCHTDDEGRFEIKGLMAGLEYKMIARSDSNSANNDDRFTIDLTDAEPGNVIELGDVTGPRATAAQRQPERAPQVDSISDVSAEPGEGREQSRSPTDRPEARDHAPLPTSYSGRVTNVDGHPLAQAKVWLAIASYDDEVSGSLQEVSTTDEQGGFRFDLDAATVGRLRMRGPFGQVLVATAADHGLDWLALDVFEDDAAASEQRVTLQGWIDKSLGAGRFAGRTLMLRPEERPVRGRLLDLEGHPLPNVTVHVEDLHQPDIPLLLKAFRESSKDGFYAAINATGVGVGDLSRRELQQLIAPVTTDKNGAFELSGIGDDQLVTLSFAGERVQAQTVHVLGRTMETVHVPHVPSYPNGTKDVYAGRDFTYAVGPSVPVEGVVKDFDTGEPIPRTVVSVERLYSEGGGADEGQLRLDTRHMRAVTDEQGRFRITGMPPGIGHVLEADPPRSEPYLLASQDVSLSLDDGEAKEIEIQVKKGIWIEGRVTDKQSGRPLSGAVDYMALRKNPHTLDKLGLKQAWQFHRYRIDSEGRFRTLGLPGPGVVLVQAEGGYPRCVGAESVDGYEASKGGGYIPTTPFVWPLTNWNFIKQIDPAADATSFTCDVVLDGGQSVPGRVVGPDGESIAGLNVLGEVVNVAFWKPHAESTFTVEGYDGTGPRQLFFKTNAETLVGQYRLEGDAPEEIVVTLEPAVRVTGRLVDNETDLPAQRYGLHCDDTTAGKFRIDDCRTDDEGRFEIKGLVVGIVYNMNAANERHFVNNRNRFTIDLTDANPGDVIELGDVTGPNSRNAGNREKAMERTEAHADSSKSSIRPQDGNEDVQRTQTRDEDQGIVSTCAGTVVDVNDQPVAGAQVAVIAMRVRASQGGDLTPSGEVLAEGKSDESGRFRLLLHDVSGTSHRYANVVARRNGAAIAWERLNLDAPPADVSLLLRPEEPIRVRLIDIDGQPADGVRLFVRGIMKRTDGSPPTEATEGVGYHGGQEAPAAWVPPVTSDERGRFMIPGVPAGFGVYLNVEGSDRFSPQDIALNTGMPEHRGERDATYRSLVKNAGTDEEAVLALAPAQLFEGVIRYEDTGEPAPHARLTIWASDQEPYGSMVSVAGKADAEGRYWISPNPGIRFGINAYPPEGVPYLARQTPTDQAIRWQASDRVKQVDVTLPRGVLVRGRVVEVGTGEPVPRASIQYIPESVNNDNTADDILTGWQGIQVSDEEGRFEIAVLPGPGRLIAHGPDGKYVLQEIGDRQLSSNRPGGQRRYVHAIERFDPPPDAEVVHVTLQLQPGSSVSGHLVDEQGEPIDEALVITRLRVSPYDIFWRAAGLSPTLSGRFELTGLDADQEYAVHFLDTKHRRGATAMLRATDDEPVVVLQPCGQAKMRFVDEKGRPVADHYPTIRIVVTPGPSRFDVEAMRSGEFLADSDFIQNVDRTNYQQMPKSDQRGEVRLPALIPGANYRIMLRRVQQSEIGKDFQVRAGETLDLGEFVIEQPE